jgi:hypothetical protein
MPSAPLQTAGKLGVDVPDEDTPSSAGIGTGRGKKSFLRPFLLGGRKKKGEMPAAAMHKSKREEGSEVHAIEKMVDDHLQVDFEIPESPQEIIASTPQHDSDGDEHGSGEASPVWAPLGKGKKGVSKRVAEMRVDEGVPSSPGISTPITAQAPLTPLTPVTPISPVSPSIVDSPIPSPVPTPITAFIDLTPVEASIPFTPVPITPITPSLATTTPPSSMISTPSSPIPTTPTTTNKSSAHRDSGRKLGHGHDRHHHRKPDETSDERRRRKDREHARREDRSEERRARSSEIEKVEKEDTWLEVVFEDLPFGPDQNMVSPLFLFQLHSSSLRCTRLVTRPNTDT